MGKSPTEVRKMAMETFPQVGVTNSDIVVFATTEVAADVKSSGTPKKKVSIDIESTIL